MDWTEQVFRYCERGSDPSAWAEPFNAASNLAFVAAAIAAVVRVARRPVRSEAAAAVWLLIALAGAVGIGSFYFHTVATRAGMLADVVPIGLFMVVYLGFALRTVLDWSLIRVGLGLAAFAALFAVSAQLPCRPAGPGLVDAMRLADWCLNGSIGYLPALVALSVVAVLARPVNRTAARSLAIAAIVFALSLVARSLDLATCPLLRLGPLSIGGHALWHLGVAVVVHQLLVAAATAAAVQAAAGRSSFQTRKP